MFTCPPTYLNCPIEISSDPSESDTTLAWVTRAMPDAVDAVSLHEGGWRVWLSCWHADDPRCQMHPDEFADVQKGVFRLTSGEIQRREMFRRMDTLEVKFAELLGELRAHVQAQPKQRKQRKLVGA